MGAGMSECRSCHRPVLWTVTPKGERAPIDIEPDGEKGNTLVLQPKAFAGEYLSVVLTGDALEAARKVPGSLRMNHWATCPDRQAWREKTDAKREGESGD
jgi:hypothetical protein